MAFEGGQVTAPAVGGGAIWMLSQNQSRLTVLDSVFRDNSAIVGGAIHVLHGVAHIGGSTFTENTADFGGAIGLENSQSVITNSTITNNTATVTGGGIDHFGRGTFVDGSSELDLINVTLVDNDAPTGRNLRNGSLNGDANARLANTIVFGGIGSIDIRNSMNNETSKASVTSLGGNVLSQTGNLVPLATDVRVNGAWLHLEPLALQPNSKVPTRALPALSLAIDRGINANAVDPGVDGLLGTPDDEPLVVDGRGEGFDRVIDGGSGLETIDAGAFEQQTTIDPLDSLIVNSPLDVQFSLMPPSAESLTLREAVDYANLLPGPQDITFDPTLSGETIVLTESALLVHESLSIVGLGAEQLTIDGDQNSRLIWHEATETTEPLLVSDVTLTGGVAPGIGGAIYSFEQTLTLRDSVITGNVGFWTGGGVAISGGQAEITDTVFTNNSVDGHGGAIIFRNASGTLRRVQASNNSVTGVGGALFAIVRNEQVDSQITIIDSEFSENTSTPLSDLATDSTVLINRPNITVENSVFSSADAPWQHPLVQANVNNDEGVSPIDALQILNALASGLYVIPGTVDLIPVSLLNEFPDVFVDVNGDGQLTPRDALFVINFLAVQANSGPESESLESQSFSSDFIELDKRGDEEGRRDEERLRDYDAAIVSFEGNLFD